MPEPALTIWILGLPFLLAVVELVRTVALIRKSPNGERGIWSQAVHVGGSTGGARTPSAAAAVSARGRPSTLAPGLR